MRVLIACYSASVSAYNKSYTYQKSLRLCHIIIAWREKKNTEKKGAELNDEKKPRKYNTEKSERMKAEKKPTTAYKSWTDALKTSDISHCNSQMIYAPRSYCAQVLVVFIFVHTHTTLTAVRPNEMIPYFSTVRSLCSFSLHLAFSLRFNYFSWCFCAHSFWWYGTNVLCILRIRNAYNGIGSELVLSLFHFSTETDRVSVVYDAWSMNIRCAICLPIVSHTLIVYVLFVYIVLSSGCTLKCLQNFNQTINFNFQIFFFWIHVLRCVWQLSCSCSFG